MGLLLASATGLPMEVATNNASRDAALSWALVKLLIGVIISALFGSTGF